jgi:predicted nucleic acid-binding protein
LSLFFVDTSALAKRYIAEVGSVWLQSWIDPNAGNTILVSEIVVTEMQSLFARRVREGLPVSQGNSAKLTFLRDIRREYEVISISRQQLLSAGGLAEKHALRALDAIHLSPALQAQSKLNFPIIFVSADKNQRNAASAEGFITDDPNAHP